MALELSDDQLLDSVPWKPKDANALLRRGIVLQAIGRYDESRIPLERAIGINAGDPNLWLQMAVALGGPGRFRSTGAKQVMAALRELRPREEQMWFAAEVDQSIAPFAAYTRAVYQSGFVGAKAGEQAYSQLVANYGNATETRIQAVVGRALWELANIAANRGESAQELRQLDGLIARYAESTDSRLHVIVASALLDRGRRMAGSGLDEEALASWNRIVSTYGDEIEVQSLVASALALMEQKYGALNKTKEQLSLLQEITRRYADHPDPLWRWLAAEAGTQQVQVLATMGDQQASHDARLDVIRRYRHDRDPIVARFALNARLEEWLARRGHITRAVTRPACRFLLRVHRLLRRPNDGIAVGHPSGGVAAVGTVLCIAAPILTVASIAGVIYAYSKEGTDRSTRSGLFLVFWLAAIASQALWPLGKRLRGRFNVGMLRFTSKRLSRTLRATTVALGVVWIAPSFEHIGEISFFDPPRYIYRFFLYTAHTPKWLDIAAMSVIVPVEVLLIAALFWLVQVFLRALLGPENALVKQVGESFPVHLILPGDEEE
jgi:tetratricopeptide (TPR) repeat protein